MAKSKFRSLLAYSKSFDCTAVQIGASGLFYTAVNLQETPRRRAPSETSGNDEAGVIDKRQSQTIEEARNCEWIKMEGKDVSAAEWKPCQGNNAPR